MPTSLHIIRYVQRFGPYNNADFPECNGASFMEQCPDIIRADPLVAWLTVLQCKWCVLAASIIGLLLTERAFMVRASADWGVGNFASVASTIVHVNGGECQGTGEIVFGAPGAKPNVDCEEEPGWGER